MAANFARHRASWHEESRAPRYTLKMFRHGFSTRLIRAAVVICFGLPVLANTLHAQKSNAGTSGYFSKQSVPDLTGIVPPAPKTGDARDESDRAIFRATRSLEGTARWSLAQQDNISTVAALLQDFSCSMGIELTPQDAPRLSTLLRRVAADTDLINNTMKNRFKRKRLFLTEAGPICIAKTPSLINSYDYPSGHVTLGWVTGLVLSELVPDRAAEILARARVFGESRMVCGVHSANAVDAGRTLGTAIFSVLNAVPEFRTDLAGAREELATLMSKHRPAESATCSTERQLISVSPFDSLQSYTTPKAH